MALLESGNSMPVNNTAVYRCDMTVSSLRGQVVTYQREIYGFILANHKDSGNSLKSKLHHDQNVVQTLTQLCLKGKKDYQTRSSEYISE